MIEMMIDSIRVSLMNYQRVVILKEKEAGRYLPIWIGPAEADAIAVKLHDVSVPRPLTHDSWLNSVALLGASVCSVVVSELRDDTFYAKIVLEKADGSYLEQDSRPSDALALAVRAKAPIYVEEFVLDKAGITLDSETGKPFLPGSKRDKEEEIDDEELRRLSAFRDLIDSLDLEGLDKSTS